jgi:hypothetical protein
MHPKMIWSLYHDNFILFKFDFIQLKISPWWGGGEEGPATVGFGKKAQESTGAVCESVCVCVEWVCDVRRSGHSPHSLYRPEHCLSDAKIATAGKLNKSAKSCKSDFLKR